MRRKRRRPAQKFNRKMRTKLMVLFSLILAVLCGLIGRLTYIEHTKGETYQKKYFPCSLMTVKRFRTGGEKSSTVPVRFLLPVWQSIM